MKKLGSKLGIGALSALVAGAGIAGEFSVTPVRIFMTPRDRAVAITVANEGDEEIVLQSELFDWAQKANGEDDLKPTEELLLAPPIVRIAPRSRQVLRLLRVGPPPVGEEQTYRLIVREVPEARPVQPGVNLLVAVAFSMPVFITPPTAKRQLACAAERAAADAVKVLCENKGQAYSLVRGIELVAPDGRKFASLDGGGYILPERKRSFALKGAAAIPAGAVKLQVLHDDGSTQTFDGALAP